MKLVRKLTRPATAIALAASLALSPVAATQAQAGNEDALIAGAIGTIILGAIATQAIGNGNIRFQSNTQSHYVPRTPTQTPTYNNRYDGRGHDDHRGGRDRRWDDHRSGRGDHHDRDWGHNRGNRGNRAAQLPAQCKTRTYDRAAGKVRVAYDARCLRRHGYSVNRH